jgi:hypothetical protein
MITSKEHINALSKRTENEIRKAFLGFADNVAKHVENPALKFSKSFTHYSNQLLGSLINEPYKNFQGELWQITRNGIEGGWRMAHRDNSAMFEKYIKALEDVTGKPSTSHDINRQALNAFINRPYGSETLSDRVWKIGSQYRNELEVFLGVGISNGDSAATLSRRIRQYLEKPDAHFKRVRDAEGNLKWSKRALNYNPGKGVYRSAYKNAMRVTRTETNRAYLRAEQSLYQSQPWVTGYEIILSDNHPVEDICDLLAGVYPKDFVFDGWHPQCMCAIIPQLMPVEDFKQWLNGSDIESMYTVRPPDNFFQFIGDNADKLKDMENKPYWFENNISIKGSDVLYHGSQAAKLTD